MKRLMTDDKPTNIAFVITFLIVAAIAGTSGHFHGRYVAYNAHIEKVNELENMCMGKVHNKVVFQKEQQQRNAARR